MQTRANQWSDFCMIGTSFMKQLKRLHTLLLTKVVCHFDFFLLSTSFVYIFNQYSCRSYFFCFVYND